ncbi:MAG: biotin--[acetyl-CoA-carboxylase] ligase [Chloroflexi bacterium RBG_16_56_11]|nr:MAG: biotin--[acetyl-CoA-carboxylase] ligase [Chloroflexi bacterium RBG_16_56_11]
MPEDFSIDLIKRGLKTRLIGRQIAFYPFVTSTMDVARRQARAGAPEGLVIVAGQQTSGRGRLRRRWFSPEGNIALSIILRPESSSLPYLVMIASLAVVSGFAKVTGMKAGIKWPNDILVNGKKICGILIENELKGNRVEFSIVGVGINVSWKPALPNGALPAAALEEESGKKISRAEVIVHLLNELDRLYLLLPDGKNIFRSWRDRLVTLGKNVTVTSGKKILQGIAESVDESGALNIRLADGSLTRIIAGDVTLRDV